MVIHLYTLRELAQEIGCDHDRAKAWVHRGKLAPTQRIGAMMVFDDVAVERARRLLAGEGMGRLPHLYQRLAAENDLRDYMTKRDAAGLIGIDEATLARWVKARKVQAYKPAGQERVLFASSDIQRLATERRHKKAA